MSERRSIIAAANTGLRSAGTGANNTGVGTVAWTNLTNGGSSNDVYVSAALSPTRDFAVDDNSVRIYDGSAFVGTDQASATNWALADATRTYGGAGLLMGLAGIKPATINASSFGCGISAQRDASTPESNYFLATNFGFTIPSSARITGLEIQVECHYENSVSSCFVAGTLILTPHGWVPIDYIKLGDWVISFDRLTRKIKVDRVVALLGKIVKRTYRVKAGRSQAIVTDNHKFLTLTGYKPLSELRVGSIVYLGVDITPTPIEEIDMVRGEQEVYDLQTEFYHSFIAEDFIVHNLLFIFGSTTAFIDHVQMRVYYNQLVDVIGSSAMMVPIGR